jgi:hypothetical protein
MKIFTFKALLRIHWGVNEFRRVSLMEPYPAYWTQQRQLRARNFSLNLITIALGHLWCTICEGSAMREQIYTETCVRVRMYMAHAYV